MEGEEQLAKGRGGRQREFCVEERLLPFEPEDAGKVGTLRWKGDSEVKLSKIQDLDCSHHLTMVGKDVHRSPAMVLGGGAVARSVCSVRQWSWQSTAWRSCTSC